ncbi:MAG: polysaccharide deacetylase family protein [Candidatus Omnitrophica bacterium]|nr:polysaccharide deacetylase family protein [Candidatus Omnitrophota bacterium]
MKLSGTIQLDLDGHWVLWDYFGRKVENNSQDPAFLSGVPRYLNLLDQWKIKTTFFIVGEDLKTPEKRRLVQEIHNRGHEIANHSLHHRTGFARLSAEEKKREIVESHRLIEEAVGEPPVGFRAPGYDFDEEVLDLLTSLRYEYDSSLLATYWGGALRRLDGSGKTREVSSTQYGRFLYGRAPLRPYHPRQGAVWKQGKRRLIEFPISTIPIFRLPFHGTFALKGGLTYFKFGLVLLKRSRGTLNYVFHALEFSDPVPETPLPFTVAGHIPWEKKKKFYREIFSSLTRHYEILPTRDLLRSKQGRLLG